MSVQSPSHLKTSKTYQLVYPDGTKKSLGKFMKIKEHSEQHLMSYGSPTVLPKNIVFEKHTLKDTEVFPRNEWSRLGLPTIHETPSVGGRRRTHKRSSHRRHHKKSRTSRRKSKSKSSKKRRTHRR